MKGDPSICVNKLDMKIKDLSSIECHKEMKDTWFSLDFIVLVFDRIIKGAYDLVAWSSVVWP